MGYQGAQWNAFPYLTVSVPFMPACSWLSTLQKYVYFPGFRLTLVEVVLPVMVCVAPRVLPLGSLIVTLCGIPAGVGPPTRWSFAPRPRTRFAWTGSFVAGLAAGRRSRLGPAAPSVPPAGGLWRAPQFVLNGSCAVRSLEGMGITAALSSPR